MNKFQGAPGTRGIKGEAGNVIQLEGPLAEPGKKGPSKFSTHKFMVVEFSKSVIFCTNS
jgi:hypothetical protein